MPKYDNTASIIDSGGRTIRQLTALTVALEKNTSKIKLLKTNTNIKN